jgi:putative DNA primase/helicase
MPFYPASATTRCFMFQENFMGDDEFLDEDDDLPPIPEDWFTRPAPQSERPDSRSAPQAPGKPNLRCLADLPEQLSQWLWPGRVPRGALTLLCGEAGRGKSLLALDIAARVTSGQSWPDGAPGGEPGDVLILSAEDSIGRTVRSRLIAHGADLQRVFYFKSGAWLDPDQSLNELPAFSGSPAATRLGLVSSWSNMALARDAREIKSALERLPECRLILIDPIPAYLEAGRMDSAEAARDFLGSLATMADRTGAAVLAVMQLDRARPNSADKRHFARRALAESARAIYSIDHHPELAGSCALLPVKNNLGDARTALSFRVTGSPAAVARIAWNPVPFEPAVCEAALDVHPQQPSSRCLSEVDRAIAWLQGALAAGPVPSQELIQRAAAAGIARSAFYRARTRLGIQASNESQIGGAWNCTLPGKVQRAAEILSTPG